MKIGIDIRAIGKKRTGDEVYFFNLVKNLAKISARGGPTLGWDKGNEYYLYTDCDPEKDTALKKEISKLELGNNFKIIFINSPNRFWWNLWALPENLKKNPTDIFHTQYIAPFWLPKNTKLVLTIHDISFNFFPQYIKKSDLFFLKTLLPRSIRRADKIITVSQNERKQIINFYKILPEKVDFAYNGVDYGKFSEKYSNEEKEGARKKYNLPDKFLLYVGTLQPRKNIPALLAALDVFYKKYKIIDSKLVIVGNRKAHNYDRHIDEYIEKYNLGKKVIFPGWVEDKDLPKIYQLAQCFAFPSLYEGFGIPVIEAMVSGTPVVCSDIPVLREIGEDAALFCDSNNSHEFAENISRILNDQLIKERLIQSGIEIAKKFTWQKTAEKTFSIYQSLT